MGKLTVRETEDLQAAGILKESTVIKMREKGLVSTRRNNKQYLKTADGTLVSPQLYFQGIGKATYSKRMVELKEEFNAMVGKYAIKNNKS